MHAHGGFQNLFLTNEQAAAIIADDRVQGVALTGSTQAGRIVASEAAQALTKTTLELGGNDAFVVLPDADVDQAVADGAISRLRNAGQVCTSAKRYIVTEAIADEFVTKMKATFEQQVMGDPTDEKNYHRPDVFRTRPRPAAAAGRHSC
ncbi:aldehyde dehydrogenase family protein [Secundilactobacillus collinoides]|uniref:aldehyde dehydrogenase family protein n=1 Tax=Secundilactobacillus collinoides TaxID=33960 RepID=UPI001FB39D47|nr:aldehyde dehydrogenase family protein [Secundilactobacillus collinoides]